MKIKTSELQGAALDWAVAKAEGRTDVRVDDDGELVGQDEFDYSTDWAQGGPIIEREQLDVTSDNTRPTAHRWQADNAQDAAEFGPTPLIAVMRCFVSSRLGDEIAVPDELTN